MAKKVAFLLFIFSLLAVAWNFSSVMGYVRENIIDVYNELEQPGKLYADYAIISVGLLILVPLFLHTYEKPLDTSEDRSLSDSYETNMTEELIERLIKARITRKHLSLKKRTIVQEREGISEQQNAQSSVSGSNPPSNDHTYSAPVTGDERTTESSDGDNSSNKPLTTAGDRGTTKSSDGGSSSNYNLINIMAQYLLLLFRALWYTDSFVDVPTGRPKPDANLPLQSQESKDQKPNVGC